MTQEEKQLLLKDLSSRLPYGVKVKSKNGEVATLVNPPTAIQDDCWNFKPYLRPMSSMTEEERKELRKLCEEDLSEFAGFIKDGHGLSRDGLYMFDKCRQLDFCLSHHLDFRGLIPMGLALEATEGMYKD